MGQYQRAIQDLDEAIRLDPQYAHAYFIRGTAYDRLGQTEQANQDFDEAIRLDPSLKRPPPSAAPEDSTEVTKTTDATEAISCSEATGRGGLEWEETISIS